jgi:hypothetical protein
MLLGLKLDSVWVEVAMGSKFYTTKFKDRIRLGSSFISIYF